MRGIQRDGLLTTSAQLTHFFVDESPPAVTPPHLQVSRSCILFQIACGRIVLLPLSRWCDTPKIILKTPLPRRHKDKDKKKYHKRHYIASRWSPCWSSTAAGGIIRKSVVLRFFWHPTFVHTTRVGRESAISPSSNWGEIGGVSGIGRYNRPHRRSGACIPFLLWYYVGYIHFSLLIIDNTRNILCYYSLIV